jgi:2-ketocyclohexanecarboxyl-CoA hydrolase
VDSQDLLYQDLLYGVRAGVATITINRPAVRNVLRTATCEELIDAFRRASRDRSVGVVVLTGAGGHAFCTGSDQGERATLCFLVEEVYSLLRDVAFPVIAKVRGYAIGAGNVLAALCDLTIASETAVFGQIGSKLGSVDSVFGPAYLSRIVGEKKAREMWYLCRRYPASEALAIGLVNAVVPDNRLDAEVVAWCAEILGQSPTALALIKHMMNAKSDPVRGHAGLALQALELFHQTRESQEGLLAVQEQRAPQFRKRV